MVDTTKSSTPTIPAVKTSKSNELLAVERHGIQRFIHFVSPISVFVILLGVWQTAVVVFEAPTYLLPAPSMVWTAMTNSNLNWEHTIWITAQEALGGFLIAAVVGVTFGGMIAASKVLSRSMMPFLVVFNTIPKVALAPLFIIYLGFGVFPNMVIAASIAFFPVVITTAIGLGQTDEDLIDLARSLQAPAWKTFFRIRVPNAMPHVVGGLKVSSTMAVTGAIVGEFVASQSGLGNLMIQTLVNLNTALSFAALAYLSLLGLAFYGSIVLLARIFVPWASGRTMTQ